MRVDASCFYVDIVDVVVVILYASFTGDKLLMLSAERSTNAYYDTAAVATDTKECSKIGTCVYRRQTIYCYWVVTGGWYVA